MLEIIWIYEKVAIDYRNWSNKMVFISIVLYDPLTVWYLEAMRLDIETTYQWMTISYCQTCDGTRWFHIRTSTEQKIEGKEC